MEKKVKGIVLTTQSDEKKLSDYAKVLCKHVADSLPYIRNRTAAKLVEKSLKEYLIAEKIFGGIK